MFQVLIVIFLPCCSVVVVVAYCLSCAVRFGYWGVSRTYRVRLRGVVRVECGEKMFKVFLYTMIEVVVRLGMCMHFFFFLLLFIFFASVSKDRY